MDRRDGLAPSPIWERAGVRERSLAHVFNETFGVNSAFNAEVFVAPPHAVAMESICSGRDGVVIGLRHQHQATEHE